MMLPTGPARPGLTLVEVLAALVILAAAAGACVAALRGSGDASRRAQGTLDALAALEAWELADESVPGELWRWSDDRGRVWVVVATPGDAAGALPSSEGSPTGSIELDWSLVSVGREHAAAPELVVRRLARAAAPRVEASTR